MLSLLDRERREELVLFASVIVNAIFDQPGAESRRRLGADLGDRINPGGPQSVAKADVLDVDQAALLDKMLGLGARAESGEGAFRRQPGGLSHGGRGHRAPRFAPRHQAGRSSARRVASDRGALSAPSVISTRLAMKPSRPSTMGLRPAAQSRSKSARA